ncbi:MAG: AAA family ATPase [bacterium]|nr:AAA family ATPase [bacterium]
MKKIPGYIIQEKIDDTRFAVVYRGQKENTPGTVIIKDLKTEAPTPSEIARFKQGYEDIRRCAVDGIITVYDIIEHHNSFALIQEDFDGAPLKQFLSSNKMSIKRFLKIAIALADILGHLHKENIIHKNINPGNILINKKSGKVKISGFGEKETLAYISPEQSGRMNRDVDYRTDIYSLGIVFYEMLTGSVPFETDDPMDMIHSHIARKPVPPFEYDSSIPEVLSLIVMKLLSKTAEERYQGCFGLKADLEKCLEQLNEKRNEKGKIKKFELAKHDISIEFRIPRVLVGRGKEIIVLMETFDRICASSTNSVEAVLVSGHPGIGKSVLINEIHKPIVAKKGYFISGKYDQFRRDIPYSALIQAFQGLVEQILTESEENIRAWSEAFKEALAPNGKILCEVIPSIEIIIGKQPPVPEPGPEESQNRFNIVFINFVNALVKKNRPIVLFLDDLQWADSASFKLLNMLISNPAMRHLFLIGAYRDTEVDEHHLLKTTIREIENAQVPLKNILLLPLTVEQVGSYLSSLFRCKKEAASALAEIIHNKTGGNPFFVNQFLKTLYERDLLKLDPQWGWKWNIEAIRQMKVTENVVEFMAGRIAHLPPATQEILKICASIGNRFDLETVSMIYEKPIEETLAGLTYGIQEGMISFYGNRYMFYHDRIEEAAYSLIPEDKRAAMHYKIGSYLLKNTKKEELNDSILVIVDQLNSGISMISMTSSEEEKYKLAGLNLEAAKKARLSAAYESAFNYFKNGLRLIQGMEFWQKEYALALALYTGATEAAYLNNNYEEMEEFASEILEHAGSILDTVRVYEIRISALMAQNRLHDAVAAALVVLKMLGVKFPKRIGKFAVLVSLFKIKSGLLLSGKDSGSFTGLPKMSNPYSMAAMRVMSKVSTSAYFIQPELILLIALKGVSLSIKYGNCPESAFTYIGYGFVHQVLGDIDSAYTLGTVALTVLNNMEARGEEPKSHLVVNTFIRHWKEHVRNTLEPLWNACLAGLETGDIDFAGHNAMMYCVHLFLTGKNLEECHTKMLQFINSPVLVKQTTQLRVKKIYHQAVLNLVNVPDDPCRLTGESYSEEIMLPLHLEGEDRTALSEFYFIKLVLCYTFEDYSQALEMANKSHELLDARNAAFSSGVNHFYDSLTRLALYHRSGKKEQKRILTRVRENLKKIKKWAFHAPMNYQHKYYLVKAEHAAVLGIVPDAIKYYNLAAREAGQNGFLSEEALAYELTAKFWLFQKNEPLAQFYAVEARKRYSQWGALSKVKHMEEGTFSGMPLRAAPPPAENNSGNLMDLSTVIKISQAISSEIDPYKLLEKIMKFSIENAGAEKVFLILINEDDKKLYIEASGNVGVGKDEEFQVLQSVPLEQSNELPLSIINFVNKTQDYIVLNNAQHDNRFINDQYIIKNRSRSILCAPIMYKGVLSGIIYLENNLTTDAFTPARVEVLQIFSTQAAISIENSRLLAHREIAAALKAKIEIAAHIQRALVPENPAIDGFEITAYMKPADVVGGDYYDVINGKDNDWLIIGDVSGHGVPAGLIMMMVQTAIQTVLKRFPDTKPSELLVMVNEAIEYNLHCMDEEKYMTITAFSIDKKGNALHSGLHQNLLLYRKESARVEIIKTNGLWLSWWDLGRPRDLNFELTLNPGDTLLLFTDGITEARNSEKKLFSEKRLASILEQWGTSSSGKIKDVILDELEGYSTYDDATMVVLKKN